MERAFTSEVCSRLNCRRLSPPGALVLCGFLCLSVTPAGAQTIDPFYASDYSFVDLGSVAGVPTSYGGLTFLAGDTNTLLLGGSANTSSGAIYRVPVTRDVQGHISSFGVPTFFAAANGSFSGIDGGLTYGPGGVLFYTSWPDNEVGQIEPGSVGPDRLIDLTTVGITSSPGVLMFVPPGFAGAGRLKLASFGTSEWFDTTVSPDGSGTYNIAPVGPAIPIGGGPEGIVYIDDANPVFTADSMLVCEWTNGRIVSYEIDGNGDPLVGTQRVFMTDLTGALGAVMDPVTGDFLFSTFGGGDHIIRVTGFIPEPGSLSILLGGCGILVVRRRRAS